MYMILLRLTCLWDNTHWKHAMFSKCPLGVKGLWWITSNECPKVTFRVVGCSLTMSNAYMFGQHFPLMCMTHFDAPSSSLIYSTSSPR